MEMSCGSNPGLCSKTRVIDALSIGGCNAKGVYRLSSHVSEGLSHITDGYALWSPSPCHIVLIHCNEGPIFYQDSSLFFLVSVMLMPLSTCWHHPDLIIMLRPQDLGPPPRLLT